MAKKKARGKFLALGAVGVLVTVAVLAGLFGDYLGLRVGVGLHFTILNPNTLELGKVAVIEWDVAPENTGKYPFDKVEYCPGSFFSMSRTCTVLATEVPNNGWAEVDVPTSLPLGRGYIKMTARKADGTLVPHEFSTRRVRVEAPEESTPTPTFGFSTPTPLVTPTPTPTPLVSPTPGVSPSPTPTPTPTETPEPSDTPTPTPEVSNGRVQCPASSPTVTFSSRVLGGTKYTHQGASGVHRVEVVGMHSWANQKGVKNKASFHGSSFFVVQNALVKFGSNNRVKNGTLHFSSLVLKPPYLNSEQRVAEAAFGLDHSLNLTKGDVLFLVMDGVKGKYNENRGDLEVRICPNTDPVPTREPKPTENPQTSPTPNSSTAPGQCCSAGQINYCPIKWAPAYYRSAQCWNGGIQCDGFAAVGGCGPDPRAQAIPAAIKCRNTTGNPKILSNCPAGTEPMCMGGTPALCRNGKVECSTSFSPGRYYQNFVPAVCVPKKYATQ